VQQCNSAPFKVFGFYYSLTVIKLVVCSKTMAKFAFTRANPTLKMNMPEFNARLTLISNVGQTS